MISTTGAISSNDCVQPFYFQQIAARGAVVKLENSFVESVNGHVYPTEVNELLAQCLAATTLMSTHLKFSARLSIQARALSGKRTEKSAIDFILAETYMQKLAEHQPFPQQLSVRGLARIFESFDGEIKDASLSGLLGPSQLAVTIEPDRGERYQGIVNAQSTSLAASLEDYFRQSEQLDTCLLLFASKNQSAGLMLQEMPNHGGKSERCPIGFEDERQASIWQELVVLARSMTAEELLGLTAEDSLRRLFHQNDYLLGEPAPVRFACSCSPERTAAALTSIGAQQLEEILVEDGEIVMDCEFCSARYRFDRKAIENLKKNQAESRFN